MYSFKGSEKMNSIKFKMTDDRPLFTLMEVTVKPCQVIHFCCRLQGHADKAGINMIIHI